MHSKTIYNLGRSDQWCYQRLWITLNLHTLGEHVWINMLHVFQSYSFATSMVLGKHDWKRKRMYTCVYQFFFDKRNLVMSSRRWNNNNSYIVPKKKINNNYNYNAFSIGLLWRSLHIIVNKKKDEKSYFAH